MTLTLTDMFCGAGGSSTGAISVPGIEVRTAMNHWARAIETHNANHPDAAHVQADISQTDPRYVAHSDILWASPECTNHSVAKGRKRITNQPDLFGESIADEAADRSRATMWDVPRFAEHHDYKLIITENVVDAARWVMFDAWLMAMKSLGYEHHIVYLNSMHAQLGGLPAPQSRDRMYVMFWKKGNPRPDFDQLRPMAYCSGCEQTVRAMQVFKKTEQWGRYNAQYVYRCPNSTCRNQIVEPAWLPASHAIDWSLRGQRIGDRTKPLADKTMARIRAGLQKYHGRNPLQIHAQGNTYDSASTGRGNYFRVWPTTEALRTQTGSSEHGLLVPVEGRDGKEARHAMEAMRTQTTRNETGVLVPPTKQKGGHHMLMEYYGNGVMHPTSKAIPTISTTDRFAMVTTMRGTSPEHLAASSAPISDPFGTFSAGGQHHGVTEWTVPDVNECEFRMLEPHEITAGMAFPKDYIMTGNKREQVKQAGNAVTPPAARDLITIGAAALGMTA